jgi:hypothetical protein
MGEKGILIPAYKTKKLGTFVQLFTCTKRLVRALLFRLSFLKGYVFSVNCCWYH